MGVTLHCYLPLLALRLTMASLPGNQYPFLPASPRPEPPSRHDKVLEISTMIAAYNKLMNTTVIALANVRLAILRKDRDAILKPRKLPLNAQAHLAVVGTQLLRWGALQEQHDID
jgi:hypothetical protein